MNVLGKILLKTYSGRTNTLVGAVLSGFVALFSTQGRLYLKNTNSDGDRLLSAGLQYITDETVLNKLRVESDWNKNIFNGGNIDVGEFEEVIPGQRAVVKIPSDGRYYIVEVISESLIIRSSTSYQDVYVKDITSLTQMGSIFPSEHKLIPSDTYHVTAYQYETGKTIKTEIGYEITDTGTINWSSSPGLPGNSKIIIRL